MSVNIICVLLDGHDLIVEIEPVGDPLEAGDLLVLSLHHPTHLLHLSSEIMNSLTLSCYTLTSDSLEICHGLLQVRTPGQGGQGPGVGLHVIGAEQQQRGQVVAAHDDVTSLATKMAVTDSRPAPHNCSA